MVSVPDEATAYAMKAIKNLKFNYVHMLILLGYGARSRRAPRQQASARWVRVGNLFH